VPSPLLQKLTTLEIPESSVEQISSMIDAVRDWEGFLREVESHGLSGLALKHVNDHQLEIPAAIKLSLKALLFRHKAHADARYKVAAELLQQLRAADCPVLVLKGLALSPLIYPGDGYRPMRDIDILVPRRDKTRAAQVIRDLGFELPESHPDKYNRDSHQMPNAWKNVDGFKISVEIHHDAIERDAPGHLFHEGISPTQCVRWREIELETLGHKQMLHQLCRHLQGRHPGSRLKLINVADIVLYSEKYLDSIDWREITDRYPHVSNTLKCLHLIMPLSTALQQKIGGVNDAQVEGVGEIMPILKDIVYEKMPLTAKLRALLLPPDWWLHLFYDVPPGRSLFFVKLWRHPVALVPFFGRRIVSRILGG
jgi:hypothetical protein